LARIATQYGPWHKDRGPEGAHYIEASANPFVKKGICCVVCVFYDGGACDIVKGSIEPDAVCKLWVIPQQVLP